ncbi:MAG TPA: multiheme c-type cytochrome [Pyrinomonadaceae bacterium]|nr:multiheme c-type cytochrome [Pyrinomonadaceae bacterium]
MRLVSRICLLVLICVPFCFTARARDDECLSCHKNYHSYFTTAHHLTSRLATRESILGRFNDTLKTPEPELFYRLEAKPNGFFQTGVLGTPPDTVSISQRFDLVIGSGRKGQTYLYWGENDRLFQLPLSYWTALGSWVNSPGYGDRTLDFSRPVLPRCLECHASSFQPDANVANRYQRANFVLGVSCERCHGPAAQHIALNSNPNAKPEQQAIVNPAKLPRERQIDLCGLCHGGVGVAKTRPFSFTVGNVLADHIQLEHPAADEPLDVHGNQLALLERSKCFKESNMTCSTCHDVHQPQRDAGYFSDKCLQCHKVQNCGLFPKRGRALIGKCVDCHLPNQSSNVIFSSHDRVRITPKVRNHWIKVYR